MFLIDNPIDISLMSDLPYRSPISISHTDIGSHLVTVVRIIRGPHATEMRIQTEQLHGIEMDAEEVQVNTRAMKRIVRDLVGAATWRP